ncbi:MAG: hypothetical protein ACLUOI_33510 [Eisenbergiella sp.]
MSVLLGPGILNNIFDGIERPLSEIAKESGKYITRRRSCGSLDTQKKWPVTMKVAAGDVVCGGTVIAETPDPEHYPPFHCSALIHWPQSSGPLPTENIRFWIPL